MSRWIEGEAVPDLSRSELPRASGARREAAGEIDNKIRRALLVGPQEAAPP